MDLELRLGMEWPSLFKENEVERAEKTKEKQNNRPPKTGIPQANLHVV